MPCDGRICIDVAFVCASDRLSVYASELEPLPVHSCIYLKIQKFVCSIDRRFVNQMKQTGCCDFLILHCREHNIVWFAGAGRTAFALVISDQSDLKMPRLLKRLFYRFCTK